MARLLTTDENRALKNPPPVTNPPLQSVSSTAEPSQELDETGSLPEQAGIFTEGPATFIATENKLHDYSSYTYGLSLHALTVEDYNWLVDNPGNWKPTTTLIGDASRYKTYANPDGSTYGRSVFFQDDFYFEELKIHSVIAPNAETKATNGIDVTFTIIEPYGMTLMNRLLDLGEYLGIENYLQIPYVIEIGFRGYDDSGASIAIPLTKWYPINIKSFKMRATVKGTEYNFEAVPYNHESYNQSFQSIPINVEIKASTVNDYLNNNDSAGATLKQAKKLQSDDASRKDVAKQSATSQELDPGAYQTPPKNAQPVTKPGFVDNGGGAAFGNPNLSKQGKKANAVREPESTTTNETPTESSPPPTLDASSLATAYNSYQQSLVVSGFMLEADTIGFVILDDGRGGVDAGLIKNAKVAIPKRADAAKTTMAEKDSTQARANDKTINEKTPSLAGNQTNRQVFSILAGTSIIAAIDDIIINSTYITDQLINTEKENAPASADDRLNTLSKRLGNTPVKWYKIVPKVQLGKYDPSRGFLSKHVDFYIIPYLYYNTRDIRAARAALPNPVKNYEFLYTGYNRDVIDFNIEFNKLFVNSLQINKNQKEVVAKYKGSSSDVPTTAKTEIQTNYQQVQPTQNVLINSDANNSAGAVSRSDAQNAQSFKTSIYSVTGGDMVNLDLKIIGDPDFIKQDDVLFGPEAIQQPDGQFIAGDGSSLQMDTGIVFCNVVFNTPADIDPSGNPRGQLKYYGSSSSSAFSGFFAVREVESEFRQGKFLQTLKMYRVPGGANEITANSAGSTTSLSRESSANNDSGIIKSAADNPQVSGGRISPSLPSGRIKNIQSAQTATSPAWVETYTSLPAPPGTETVLLKSPDAPGPIPPQTKQLTKVVNNGATLDTSGLSSQLSSSDSKALADARARYSSGVKSGTVFTQ